MPHFWGVALVWEWGTEFLKENPQDWLGIGRFMVFNNTILNVHSRNYKME